jgi:serine/threonine-protein kinase
LKEEDGLLSRLARSIDEGVGVDWSSTESSTTDEATRRVISELAVIAAISAVHCSAPLPDDANASARSAESKSESLPAWGTFHLLEKIGEGAHGEVYRARDTRLDREVALKLLPAAAAGEGATSIIEEGRLLARVRHPNVVTIYGAERIDNRIGLWMELVKGQTLEQMLETRKVLSYGDVVTIGIELCGAVEAVHGAGLLHRDIKAHNVMRSRDGRIVLMDFGTGRTLEDEAPLDLAGTPLYLAPEVLAGEPPTVRSDVYSLGILLYHIVTGSYPVKAATVREIRRFHERGERTAVQVARSDVPPRLARVIERSIAPRPELRYENAGALSADLAALRPRPKIVRVAMAAATAIACIAVVGAGWEIVGRRIGASTTPGLLLASVVDSNVTVRRPVERPVVAVLPFKNLSTEPESDYFADGLTDEVIRNLSIVEGLQVVSSTSTFAFKDAPRDLDAISQRLGANLVVEGSVLRDGSRLRINARLTRVADDLSLWTDEFDRPVADIFSIHAEISRALVARLQLKPGNQARRPNTNLDAYDSYLQGRALIDRRGVSNAAKAAELFERAIGRDPKFAPAHAGLANAYAFLSFPHRGSLSFAAAFPTMKRAAETSVQLDPELAQAHMAMGWVYSYQHDWPNAERAFQRAISLDPSLTQAYTSYSLSTLQSLRKFDEALRLLRTAAVRDPLSLDVQREIGELYLFGGRYDEAIDAFQRLRDIQPDYPFVQPYLAQALTFGGRLDDAIRLIQPSAVWPISIYVRTGERAKAEKIASEHYAHAYRRAIIAAAMGDTLTSVGAIEEVAASDPQRIGRLLNEPQIAVVRNHPRIVALRKTFNLP